MTIFLAWTCVFLIVGMWLYLSGASMLWTYLKQRRLGDDDSSYGAQEGRWSE